MSEKKISHVQGKGCLSHNNRTFIPKNTNPERCCYNSYFIQENIADSYDKLFGKAVALSSDTFEDGYYFSEVNTATGEEIAPYRSSFGDISMFVSVDSAVQYAEGAGITLSNTAEQLNEWRRIEAEAEAERERQLNLSRSREMIKRLPMPEKGEYEEHFVLREDAIDWIYFNPDGADGEGQFVVTSLYADDFIAAYNARSNADDSQSAFIEAIQNGKQTIINADTEEFERLADTFIKSRSNENVIVSAPVVSGNKYDGNFERIINLLENHFEDVRKYKENHITEASENISVEGHIGTWYVNRMEAIRMTAADTFRKEIPQKEYRLEADTKDYVLDGQEGTWSVVNSAEIDGRQFFELESDNYGYTPEVGHIIADVDGNVIAENVHSGFKNFYLEKARETAHNAGLPFREAVADPEEEFNPYAFDGTMSPEDYELMHKLMREDSFEIYQVKSGEEYHDKRFAGLSELGGAPNVADYDLVYSGKLSEIDITFENKNEILESIFTKFNTDRPEDFKGHSLSVSDVVVLHKDDTDTAHYVDIAGFSDVPEFFITLEERFARETLTNNLALIAKNQLASDELDELAESLFNFRSNNIVPLGNWVMGRDLDAITFGELMAAYNDGKDIRAELAKHIYSNYGELGYIETFERGKPDFSITSSRDDNGMTFSTNGGFSVSYTWEELGEALINVASAEYDRHKNIEKEYEKFLAENKEFFTLFDNRKDIPVIIKNSAEFDYYRTAEHGYTNLRLHFKEHEGYLLQADNAENECVTIHNYTLVNGETVLGMMNGVNLTYDRETILHTIEEENISHDISESEKNSSDIPTNSPVGKPMLKEGDLITLADRDGVWKVSAITDIQIEFENTDPNSPEKSFSRIDFGQHRENLQEILRYELVPDKAVAEDKKDLAVQNAFQRLKDNHDFSPEVVKLLERVEKLIIGNDWENFNSKIFEVPIFQQTYGSVSRVNEKLFGGELRSVIDEVNGYIFEEQLPNKELFSESDLSTLREIKAEHDRSNAEEIEQENLAQEQKNASPMGNGEITVDNTPIKLKSIVIDLTPREPALKTVSNQHNSYLTVQDVVYSLRDLQDGYADDYDWKNYAEAFKNVLDSNVHTEIALPLYKSEAYEILLAAERKEISADDIAKALKNLELVLQNSHLLKNPEEKVEQISFFDSAPSRKSSDEIGFYSSAAEVLQSTDENAAPIQANSPLENVSEQQHISAADIKIGDKFLFQGEEVTVSSLEGIYPDDVSLSKFKLNKSNGDKSKVKSNVNKFSLANYGMIHLSRERELDVLNTELDRLEEALREMDDGVGRKSFSVKQIEKAIKTYKDKIEKLLAKSPEDDMLCFEKLGIDKIFVDESQAYKNLDTPTKMRNVSGIGSGGSGRSMQLLMKCKYLDELTGGKGTVFASGTPISNSMSEMYTLMRYLQADKLAELGINSFDRWASVFGETTTSMELSPEGNGKYQMKTRFAKFQNLPELMNIFKECADIKTAESLDLDRPDFEMHNVNVPATAIQATMIKELGERAKEIRAGHVDPTDDNMCKLTVDGRKIGLDQRCMNPNLPDDPKSKVNVCINNVFDIWQRTAEEKSTQLIFCDLATPQPTLNENTYTVYRKNTKGGYSDVYSAKLGEKDTAEKIMKKLNGKKPPKNYEAGDVSDGDIIMLKRVNYEEEMAYNTAFEVIDGKLTEIAPETWEKLHHTPVEQFESERKFCVYDDIKQKLIAKGVPEKEIAFIHDVDKAEEKQRLYDKMNKGEIRVLIGSTFKCGAGMNAQERMIALHDLDAPMRPSDVDPA